MAEATTRTAFRNVKVVQEPLQDQPGTSFLFEVNNVRIFCGGSNWIPADSFLTEIEPERYRKWVDLLVRRRRDKAEIRYKATRTCCVCGEEESTSRKSFTSGCTVGMH